MITVSGRSANVAHDHLRNISFNEQAPRSSLVNITFLEFILLTHISPRVANPYFTFVLQSPFFYLLSKRMWRTETRKFFSYYIFCTSG